MKYVISGTNRHNSRTLQIARHIQNLYRELGEDVGLIDLAALPVREMDQAKYGEHPPGAWGDAVQKVDQSSGLIFVVPEYNGSMPGILKLFVDYWKYPDSFEHRPTCFVGLGGMFGGLRPVEHLQQVLGFRNAYIFPQRVFLTQIFKALNNGVIQDPTVLKLFEDQARGFQKFVRALENEGLDARSQQVLKATPLSPER